MGREVRRVAADWIHPTDGVNRFTGEPNHKPLYDGFAEAIVDWDQGRAKWERGLVSDYAGGWRAKSDVDSSMTFDEYSGDRPVQADYMPDWPEEEKTHYMMYETCTEGTPISPAFATPEELARWLVDNNASAFADQTASYEGWLRVCRGGFAPSMVLDSRGLRPGVDD